MILNCQRNAIHPWGPELSDWWKWDITEQIAIIWPEPTNALDFVRLPFPPEEEVVWFVPEELLQPYAVVVFNVLTKRNVAATKTTIPVDKNNRFIIVLLQPIISAYHLCFTKTLLCGLIVYGPTGYIWSFLLLLTYVRQLQGTWTGTFITLPLRIPGLPTATAIPEMRLLESVDVLLLGLLLTPNE